MRTDRLQSEAQRQRAPGGSSADFQLHRSNTDANLYAFAYEDSHFGTANDHNDMVLTMSVAAVPEPETHALMAGGLGALAWVSRRREQA